MKVFFYIMSVLSFSAFCADNRAYLMEQLVPAVEKFCDRQGLQLDRDIRFSDVVRYDVDVFTNRPGGMGTMVTVQGYQFSLFQNQDAVEVRTFDDRRQEWNRHFPSLSIREWKRIKGLPNLLNEQTAKQLAEVHFQRAGFKAEDFHPVEFQPLFVHKHEATGDRNVQTPYYMAVWYRKDVTQELRDAGEARLPFVQIVVSGVNSNMVSFGKYFMPTGKTWETQQ
jgi:hypothetical protein